MNDKPEDSSERMPYLELGKELPENLTKKPDDVSSDKQHEVHEGQSNEPQNNVSEPISFWLQMRNVPIHRMLLVTGSILVIILLLPRFLIALSPFVIQIVMIIRLLLPLFVALGIAWFILQWLRQNSR